MDIKAEIGTPILAAAPGVVISSGQERAYGRIIRIEHDSGFVTVYAHNLENLVEVGDRVTGGTIIATVGRSGRATAPHLHFEVRHEGMVYNPLHLLPAREVHRGPGGRGAGPADRVGTRARGGRRRR